MVDHKILLSILADIGFCGVSNKWFASYLSNRVVRVKIDETYSYPRSVGIGVPQGSVLGPLLFLIYTNSIFKLDLFGKCTGFADDLALAYSAKTFGDIVSQINTDLYILHAWFDKHRLVLSEKTKFILFKISGNNAGNNSYQITYHSTSKCSEVYCHRNCFTIERVDSFKYLGVYLDENLNWKVHVGSVKQYMSSASRIFYLLRDLCPVSVLVMTFYALVMAKLQYGLSCWGSCHLTNLKPLIIQQKMILRIIFRKKRMDSSWPLFKSTNILPLQHLYVYKVLRIFFKRSGQYRMRNDSRYNVRSNYQCLYNIPRFYSDHFRRWILVAAPTFFNALPEPIRRHVSCKSFLADVKSWLLERADISFLFEIMI